MFKNIKFNIILVTIIALVSLSSVTMSSTSTFKNNINKDEFSYGISVDGNIIGAMKSKVEIRRVLEGIKKYYSKDLELKKIEILEDIKIVKVNTHKKNLQTEKELLNKIISKNKDKNNPYIRVSTEENNVRLEDIPYKTTYKKNNDLYVNQKNIEEKGEEGKKEVTFKIEKINGIQVKKEVIKEVVKQEPKLEIISKGTKNEIASRGTGKFIMPLNGKLTSPFGPRWGRMHSGIDLACPTGTDIKSADNGIVKFSGHKGTYGYMILIDHGNGYSTRYAHSSKLYVKEGQKVSKGQTIAAVGSTGRSTGPHLHFEIIVNGQHKNPYNYIK